MEQSFSLRIRPTRIKNCFPPLFALVDFMHHTGTLLLVWGQNRRSVWKEWHQTRCMRSFAVFVPVPLRYVHRLSAAILGEGEEVGGSIMAATRNTYHWGSRVRHTPISNSTERAALNKVYNQVLNYLSKKDRSSTHLLIPKQIRQSLRAPFLQIPFWKYS